MRRRWLAVLMLTLAAVAAAGWMLIRPVRDVEPLPPRQADLGNGERVFWAGGCASCHATPKQPDATRLGGGLSLHSPFGAFIAPNISPHPDDGIGRWSERDFLNAAIEGTSPKGEHYYPAFPYPAYRRASPDDLRDLFAYLKTLAPVAGRAPPHELRFPFSLRAGVGVWKFLFLGPRGFAPDPAQPAPWNRGAYLVTALGHCAECHSPRNALGGIIEAQRFAGGPDPEGRGWVPNITQKRMGDWSVSDFAYFLETGQTPEGDTAGGSMAAVIRNTAKLPASDREAIAIYLKSLKPVEGPPRPAKQP